MTDLKLLDGTVEEVIAGLDGLSDADRTALLAAEREGKKRKGVIAALDPEDGSEGNGAGEANGFEASGAPAQVVEGVDPSHPAVDADPRANTTETQNRIDFNDPNINGVDVVSEQLGMTKPSDAQAAASE